VSKLSGRVLAVGVFVFGAMWLLAAGTKIASPLPAFELASHAVPTGAPPKPLLAAVIAGETCLGAAMCLRAIRGLVPSLLALLAATGVVWYLKVQAEEELIPCGCFGKLFHTTLDGALLRNVVLVVVHAGLILWNRLAKAP
jgi:methylamine utilization protein MauE